jgi:hypothetical protein
MSRFDVKRKPRQICHSTPESKLRPLGAFSLPRVPVLARPSTWSLAIMLPIPHETSLGVLPVNRNVGRSAGMVRNVSCLGQFWGFEPVAKKGPGLRLTERSCHPGRLIGYRANSSNVRSHPPRPRTGCVRFRCGMSAGPFWVDGVNVNQSQRRARSISCSGPHEVSSVCATVPGQKLRTTTSERIVS